MLAVPVMERKNMWKGNEGELNYQFPSVPLCMPALRPKSQREEEIYLLSHKWHTYCVTRHSETVFMAKRLCPHTARTLSLTLPSTLLSTCNTLWTLIQNVFRCFL
jgi:hypothetical protein